jgi:hypothetical protein
LKRRRRTTASLSEACERFTKPQRIYGQLDGHRRIDAAVEPNGDVLRLGKSLQRRRQLLALPGKTDALVKLPRKLLRRRGDALRMPRFRT